MLLKASSLSARAKNFGSYHTFNHLQNRDAPVDHFKPGILGWVLGDHSAKTFKPLWELVEQWRCYFYVTDGWKVYPMFISDGDQIICKTYMTKVKGENTRLRHYLARLKRKTLCYSRIRRSAQTFNSFTNSLF
jgi:IS1 family transposase